MTDNDTPATATAGQAIEPTNLFVVVIEHKHGNDVTVHRTEDGAHAWVRSYVGQWWDNEINGGKDESEQTPIPDDDTEAITDYFENVEGEYFTITEAPVLD